MDPSGGGGYLPGVFAITVESVFAASHTILLPDGSWEPIHGHNWPVVVEVACDELDAIDTVMDFHVLHADLVRILEPFQNRHLNDVEPFAHQTLSPTAERVAEHIGRKIQEGLPDRVRMTEVRLGEAAGCWAIWRPYNT